MMIDTEPCTSNWQAFGTRFRILVTPVSRAGVTAERARQLVAGLELICNPARRDSDLARVNVAAGHWIRTSESFLEALRAALAAARLTEGLVNPLACVMPGRHRHSSLPSREQQAVSSIAGSCTSAAWSDVELRWDGKVRIPPGYVLDLAATSPAFAADRLARSLSAELEVGLVADADGGAVRVEASPDAAVTATATIAAATAVTAARRRAASREWSEVRRGGLVQQRQPVWPAREEQPSETVWRTVSVAAGSGVLAQAAAQAAVLLGPAAVGWLARRDLTARLVDRAGKVIRVGRWPAPAA
jgi:thiamine biosynthesis lipoprotein